MGPRVVGPQASCPRAPSPVARDFHSRYCRHPDRRPPQCRPLDKLFPSSLHFLLETADPPSNVSQTNSRDSGSGTPAAPIRDSGTTLMANQNPLRVAKKRGDINELGLGSCFPQRHGRRHVDRQKMTLFQWHVRMQLTPDLHNALSNLSGAMSAHPPCFCNGAPL